MGIIGQLRERITTLTANPETSQRRCPAKVAAYLLIVEQMDGTEYVNPKKVIETLPVEEYGCDCPLGPQIRLLGGKACRRAEVQVLDINQQ